MTTSHDAPENVPDMPQPLTGKGWQIPIAHVHDHLTNRQEADPATCQALADALSLEACKSVTCDIDLTPGKRGRFVGSLRICAEITQICVVTVEAFDSMMDETVAAEFWPAKQIVAWNAERGEEAEIDEDTPDPEPIEDDMLDVGRIAYESLVVAVDPHPRAPGAALEISATETEEERAAERPFAALEKLRQQQGD